MRIMEQDQRPGRFSLELSDTTPVETLNVLKDAARAGSGFIIVQRTDGPAGVQTVAAASYIGCLDTVNGSRFEGAGLSSELGLDSGDGTRIVPDGADVDGNGDLTLPLADWVTAVCNLSGITAGTVTGPAGTFFIRNSVWEVEHRRAVLDMVCRHFGVVWRLDADVLTVGPRTTLYGAPSRVVTDRPGTQRGTAGLAPVAAYALSPSIDSRSRVAAMIGYAGDDGFGGIYEVFSSNGNGDRTSINGAPIENIRYSDRPDLDETQMAAFFVAQLATESFAVESFGVATRAGGRIRDTIPVGSRVYVWFPSAKTEDLGNPQPMNGSIAFPSERVLISSNVSVAKGVGVFFYDPNAAVPWRNLTNNVKFGDGSAFLTVSSDADYRFSPGIDRFGKEAIIAAITGRIVVRP